MLCLLSKTPMNDAAMCHRASPHSGGVSDRELGFQKALCSLFPETKFVFLENEPEAVDLDSKSRIQDFSFSLFSYFLTWFLTMVAFLLQGFDLSFLITS